MCIRDRFLPPGREKMIQASHLLHILPQSHSCYHQRGYNSNRSSKPQRISSRGCRLSCPVAYCETDCLKRSFFPLAIVDSDSLPIETATAETLASFQSRLSQSLQVCFLFFFKLRFTPPASPLNPHTTHINKHSVRVVTVLKLNILRKKKLDTLRKKKKNVSMFREFLKRTTFLLILLLFIGWPLIHGYSTNSLLSVIIASTRLLLAT